MLSTTLFRNLWNFLRDSTPSRRRQRYGDMEFDWEHRVNTTSGTVGWRELFILRINRQSLGCFAR